MGAVPEIFRVTVLEKLNQSSRLLRRAAGILPAGQRRIASLPVRMPGGGLGGRMRKKVTAVYKKCGETASHGSFSFLYARVQPCKLRKRKLMRPALNFQTLYGSASLNVGVHDFLHVAGAD